jgi:hypothetical protein
MPGLLRTLIGWIVGWGGRNNFFLPTAFWLVFMGCWPFLVLLSVYWRCPCAGRHLLFFAAAKKSRQKKAGCNRQLVVSHPSLPRGTAQDETRPRTLPLSDKALIRSSVALRAPLKGMAPIASYVGILNITLT